MNSKEKMKQIAQLAAAQGFKWIAQDGCDQKWHGYASKPEYNHEYNQWETIQGFAEINLEDKIDYSKEIFEISEILKND